MKYIGILASFVILVILNAIYSGYVLSILWGWFVSPVFNIAELTINSAIGISLVINFLTYQSDAAKEADKSDFFGKLIARIIIMPTTALIIGWIVTLFG